MTPCLTNLAGGLMRRLSVTGNERECIRYTDALVDQTLSGAAKRKDIDRVDEFFIGGSSDGINQSFRRSDSS